ncbi:MAG: hypothetical protein IIU14_05195 [Ruminococcus sp.]|nr:hypothetical protein [Ruminococcus sp.]
MNVDFKGYGENVATFIADSGVAVGNIVKLSDNFKVVNAASGDDFIGVCVGVRSGYAAVQLSGYVEVPASAQIALGRTGIAAASATAVATAQNGTKFRVIYSTSNKVGFIL